MRFTIHMNHVRNRPLAVGHWWIRERNILCYYKLSAFRLGRFRLTDGPESAIM